MLKFNLFWLHPCSKSCPLQDFMDNSYPFEHSFVVEFRMIELDIRTTMGVVRKHKLIIKSLRAFPDEIIYSVNVERGIRLVTVGHGHETAPRVSHSKVAGCSEIKIGLACLHNGSLALDNKASIYLGSF